MQCNALKLFAVTISGRDTFETATINLNNRLLWRCSLEACSVLIESLLLVKALNIRVCLLRTLFTVILTLVKNVYIVQ